MRQRLSVLRRRAGGYLMRRSATRRRPAWALAVLGPVAVAFVLLPIRDSIGLGGFLFGALIVVVAVAVMNGLWPSLAGALVAIAVGAMLFGLPAGSPRNQLQIDAIALTAFAVVAGVIGLLVDELILLADEQAALRRVSTLVTLGVPPEELFAAVAEEVGTMLPADFARIARYEPDGGVTFVSAWDANDLAFPVGSRWSLEGDSVSGRVLRTGRGARIDDFASVAGPLAAEARVRSIRTAVGAPIVVMGRLWGVMIAGSTQSRSMPADTETRLAGWTELVATTIANAESRAELAASRTRIVTAADDTRRRLERDLHDGTQQRLVSLAMELSAAEARLPSDLAEPKQVLSHAAKSVAAAVEDLQEVARGIHPAILSKGGLGPAIRALARRSSVPVELDLRVGRRLPDRVEVAAYYVVAEALTNVAKHSQASVVHVAVEATDTAVTLSIRDDGIGGADGRRGSGLIGLKDRVEALGGTIEVAGSRGMGTSVVAAIPIS
jgi:signal transduction histidine kinase